VFKLRALVVEIGFIAGLGIDVLPLNPPPKGDSLGSYLQFTNRYLCRSGFGSAQPPLSAFSSFQLPPKGDSLGSYLQFTNRYLCRSGFGSAQPPLSAFSLQLLALSS